MRYRRGFETLCLLLAAGPCGAWAEQPSLDEIVVTATRRQEQASKVPISIAAYGADALDSSGISSLAELAAAAPSVEYDVSQGFGPGSKTNLAIRGISSGVGTSTTGIYIDDTPIHSRTGTVSLFGNPMPLLFDLDRVEIDRGPQGTLFGAGSEGGVIRLIGRDPDLQSWSALARGTVAGTVVSGPTYETGAAAGGPVAEGKAGLRFSLWQQELGGFVDRVDPFTGAMVDRAANSSLSRSGRAVFSAAPTDWLKVTASLFEQSVHNHDSPAYFEGLSDPAEGRFRNGRLLRQPVTDDFLLPSFKMEATSGDVLLTSVTSYFARSGHSIYDGTSYNGAVFGPLLSYGSPLGNAFPTSPADAAPVAATISQRQFSEEVRVNSIDADAPLRWTAGLFYDRSDQHDRQVAHDPFYIGAFFGLPAPTLFAYVSLAQLDSQIAGFAQLDERLAEGLTLTLGLRYAQSWTAFSQAAAGVIVSSRGIASGKQSERPATPKLTLSYDVSPGAMIYASAAKGYRAGGGNPPPFVEVSPACDRVATLTSYNSDSLWSYELGAKDRRLGDRLQIDASVFHVDWKNMQQLIGVPACALDYIDNVGAATSNGFDLAVKARPIASMLVSLSAAYTDARMASNVVVNGKPLFQRGDAIGNPPLVDAPWNLAASVTQTVSLFGQEADITLEDLFHSRNPGPFSSSLPDSPNYSPEIPANPAFNQLNLRMSSVWGGLTAALFAENLLNAHPALWRYQDVPGSTLFTDTTLRPLTIGATLTYRM